MEGLKQIEAKLTVYVHPSKSKVVGKSILRQLSSLLFTYDVNFDGVLLAHQVNKLDRKAKILRGLVPYFGVNLEAKLLFFSPKPGKLLEGTIVKVGKDSIHVIVLGFCSVAIMSEDIRQEFKYIVKDGEEIIASRFHKRHRIKVGSMIQFLIKSFDEELLHISGSLIPAHTGCVHWLAKHGLEVGLQNDRSKKKRKETDNKSEVDDQHHNSSIKGDRSLDHNRPHKSRKSSAED